MTTHTDHGGGPAALSVLFVCTGNMHRSPMAERLLKSRLPGARVRSAGTRAQHFEGMDPATRSVLERLNGDCAGFSSVPLTAQLVAEADLVLGLERQHRDMAVRLDPLALRRSFTLREFVRLAQEARKDATTATELIALAAASRGSLRPVPRATDEIADPWGTPYEVLERCGHEIDRAVTALAALLVPYSRPSRDAEAVLPSQHC
ncbi:arsenate reductase/protein-tyrosine-phosphatase family protein [Streptomyces sp. NPDC002577]